MTIICTDDYEDALRDHEAACERLYRSELALHDARQTGIDRWISAAADKLHTSVVHERETAIRLDSVHSAA